MPRLAAAAIAATALLAGCVDFDTEAGPENLIGIVGIDVAAPEVSTGSIVLAVTATLDNLQAPSGSLVLRVKAFDQATNMLVKTAVADVGVMEKDKSKAVEVLLDLPRVHGYRLETLVEQDGRVVQVGTVQASNLMALPSTRYDTGLRVAGIDAQVLGVEEGKVRIRCPVYLTNEGGSASRPLRLQLKAREVSTSILAGDVWLDVAPIRPDETQPLEVEMAVPDGFNYALEAFIWDGQVIVETGEGKVQFLPAYTRDPARELVVSDPDISVFAEPGRSFDRGDGGAGQSYYGGRPTDSDEATETPGPSILLVAAAVLASAFILRRRSP